MPSPHAQSADNSGTIAPVVRCCLATLHVVLSRHAQDVDNRQVWEGQGTAIDDDPPITCLWFALVP